MILFTVVFPAYNESSRLRESMLQVADWTKDKCFNTELIVVENGSTDNTYEIAIDTAFEIARAPYHEIAVLVDRADPGKGSALRHGMRMAKGKYVLLSDVDLSTPIQYTPALLGEMSRNDAGIAIGSRNVSGSVVVGRGTDRGIAGSAFHLLTSLLVPGIKDTQCGFKLLSRDALDQIIDHLFVDGFSFDVELLYVARKLGIGIAEVPVYWKHDPRSTVRVVPDSLKMARDLVRIVNHHAKTRNPV